MILSSLDITVIVVFLLGLFGLSLYYTKLANQNIDQYFLGGKNLPWWLAGTSMVATTFAADTPLLITEFVATKGISGNWLWWNSAIGGLLTVFFFARYWHKAGILTDVEFIELRYSGKAASFLRAFRALYLGLFMNVVIIAWVNLALATLLEGFFGLTPEDAFLYTACSMVIVFLYTTLSGFLGIVVTDFIQFGIAMLGCLILAYLVVNDPEIGGISQLKASLPSHTLNFFPTITSDLNVEGLSISMATFFSFIAIQWWASWYPGAEPGGGGYIAQRMMSTKNPHDALKATLFFQLAHHCLRPWPWILVALASIILYPDLEPDQKRLGFVFAMRDFLPNGFKGLLLVAFLSAYMSTLSTQFNWGTSYLVNDLYKRFLKPKSTQNQLINTSRLITLTLMIVALIVTNYLTTFESVFLFVVEASAGLGLVLILRWYWWRINIWSEIIASFVPLFILIYLKLYTNLEHPYTLFVIVSITTVIWLLGTYITKPTDPGTLREFCQRVKPAGFWQPVYQKFKLAPPKSSLPKLVLTWLAAIVMLYAILIGLGELILGSWKIGLVLLALAVGISLVLKKSSNFLSN